MREKLIELLNRVQSVGVCRKPSDFDDRYSVLGSRSNEEVADHILASGFINELKNEAYDVGVDAALHNHFGLSWKDAAELRKEIKRLQDATSWISVTERLPEVCESYIVVVKYKYDYEKEYDYDVDVATYYPYDNPEAYIDNRWDTYNDWNEGQQYIHITHWMPLPDPPKE